MSTKTTFKRVALVAAVAAAFGGLSTVAANATVGAAIGAQNGTSIVNGGVATASTSSDVVGSYSVDTITSAATDHVYTIVSSGVGTLSIAAAPSAVITSIATGAVTFVGSATSQNYTVNSQTSATWFAGSTPGIATFGATPSVFTLAATSSVAGSQTITVTGDVTGAVTETITWGATPTVSAQYSTAYIASTTTTPSPTTDALPVTASKSATGVVANVVVTTNSAASTAINGTGLNVTVAGPGSVGVGISAGPAVAGRAVSVSAATAASSSVYYITVFSDGTAGTSTITIAAGTTVLATKTVTFYGTATVAKVTQGLYVVKAGAVNGQAGNDKALTGATVSGAAGTGAALVNGTAGTGTASFTATVSDAGGNAVPGATVKVVSSNTAVIASGACTEETADAPGTWQCQVTGASGALSGQTATVTFEVLNTVTAAYDILATPLTFTIGGAIAKVAIATDASSYSALAPLAIVASATDSNGNAAYDQDIALFTSAGLTASTQLGGSDLPVNTTVALISGKHTFKGFYAPTVAGSFTITGTDSTAAANVVSATASSVGGSADTQAAAATDAANEATDAANAATDAANAAADAADAATSAAQDAGAKADAALAAVTALSAKITVLAAQIAKIVKKLKA